MLHTSMKPSRYCSFLHTFNLKSGPNAELNYLCFHQWNERFVNLELSFKVSIHFMFDQLKYLRFDPDVIHADVSKPKTSIYLTSALQGLRKVLGKIRSTSILCADFHICSCSL